MKEDKITKRIKELQNDTKFTFKLTEDIIDSVYRIAVEDCSKELKDPDKVYKKKDESVVVESSKELNKKFGSKQKYDDEFLRKLKFKTKQAVYSEIMKYIEKNSDLMDVYVYVKEQAKKDIYDDISVWTEKIC